MREVDMCYGCWEEAGKPAIVNEQTVSAAKLAAAVYEHSAVGGHLHILLDDWNVEDEHLQFCAEQVATNHHEVDAEQLAAESECLTAFQRMSIAGRYTALAIYEKCIPT